MAEVVREHFRKRIQHGEYLDEIRRTLIPENLRGRLLEAGCGGKVGLISSKLEVIGIDITPEMTKLCKKSSPKVNVIVADVRMLPFKNESFDVASVKMLSARMDTSDIVEESCVQSGCGI